MSKRKKTDVNLEEDDDDDDNTHSRDKSRQQQPPPQKVYDFHKKTIEVYPARLLELNRQFVASISSQVSNEQYSVLVGNCLDYVRQYFSYEDDLLQYSPWLATRLKQSRSNIVKCLQETIDVYEALARHDFDRIVDKNHVERSSNDSVVNTTDTPAQSTASSFSFRPLTTSSSSSVLNFTNPVTTTATSESTTFNFTKSTTTSTAATNETTSYTPFNFTQPTAANVSAPSTGFNFMKSTTAVAVNDSPPPPPLSTGFSFAKTTTTTPSDPIPSTGFSFKMPTTSASPDKTTSTPPFAFSILNTGFGTSTFTPPSFRNPASTEKSSTGLASSISFTPPPQFSFGSTPVPTGEQQGTTEDNEDEPSEPPEPEKVEHEADAKLTYRCRMGVKKGDKLIKRGPVQVILKEVNDKHQLIIRSDDTLGRLYLNILWSKSVPINKNSTKDLTFVCKLNPGMPEISEGDIVVVLLRFDNETDRNDAYEKLNKERT